MKRSHLVPTAAALAALLAIGCDNPPAESGAPADETAQESAEEVIPEVQDLSPTQTVEAYENGLSELLSIATQVRSAATADEFAAEFAAVAERVSELGENLEGGNVASMELAAAMARRGQNLAQIAGQLGVELSRISADPELRDRFSEALSAYGGRQN